MTTEHASIDNDRYIVRLFDGFDFCWIDVTGTLSKEEAEKELAKYTENGTKNTCYADIDYYAIFPADTVMHYRSETCPR